MPSRCAMICIGVLAVTVAVAPERAAGRSSQNRPLALVGGTLIDGTGSAPIRDSVVLIRGERIEKIGTTDSLPVPNGYEARVHGRPHRAPRVVGSARPSDVRGPSGYALLVRHLHAAVRASHHARVGRAVADGRRDNRSRSCGAAAADPGRQEAHRERRNPRADAVRRRSGTHERREPERRTDVECLRCGRCDGEDPPVDRRRR